MLSVTTSTDTSTVFLKLLATSLIVSSVGYIKLVWFISIGYGYAVAAMAVVLGRAAVFSDGNDGGWQQRPPPLLLAQLVLLFAYGVRLGTHVLRRERNAHYQKAARENYGDPDRAGLFVKIMIWISVAPLYVAMVSPAAFHLLRVSDGDGNKGVGGNNGESSGPSSWSVPVGVAVMAVGLLLEGIADRQKAAAKKIDPDRFCDQQLYAWVRCPNYLGEILFWIGNWIVGSSSCYTAWWHWAVSLGGLGCIISIMLGSTKRLEANQRRRYGHMKEFEEYTRTVPILFPGIYSLEHMKYTLG